VIIPNSVTAALMAPVTGHVLWFPCEMDGFCGVASHFFTSQEHRIFRTAKPCGWLTATAVSRKKSTIFSQCAIQQGSVVPYES
jgi:hypothetical protein